MGMRCRVACASLWLCLSSVALGQAPPNAAPPAFEIASVRPAAPHSLFQALQRLGNRLSGIVNRDALVGFAFDLGPNQISGLGPEPNFFVVTAEMDPHSTDAQVRTMTQNLLRQRFGLVSHFALLPAKAYALIVAKTGPRLELSKPERSSPATPSGKITFNYHKGYFLSGRDVSISDLCLALQAPLHAVLIDKTGLTARYDFDLNFEAPNNPASAAAALPSIDTAFPSQLGLQLVPVTAPVKTLVVDHMNKTPSPD